MSSDDRQNDWSHDPSLSGIDFARLQALQQMASQSRGKSQAEMMPFLFSLMQGNQRSEERRVGKECRSRWSPYH